MKKLVLFFSLVSLFFLFGNQPALALSHPDLDSGRVRRCTGSSDETNIVAFHAVVTSTRTADGGLELNIVSDFAQCLKDAKGNKNWWPLISPEASNYFGKSQFSNLKLLISTDDGDLISSTDLKLTDDQTVQISAKTIKSLRGRYLEVGATAHQDFYVDGNLADQNEVFFGSYLISGF